jgi:hypothetical protein
MDLDNEELKATRELNNFEKEEEYVGKEKIKDLKNFYIELCKKNEVDLIPLKNVIDNLNILLGG